MDNPLTVSVLLLTFNQAQYIAQTLDHITAQIANFEFEVVIGEDCSTDETRGICEMYAKQYKNIKILPDLGENIGLISNYFRTIKQCRGKYIAICDGDDYWEDKFKLQKQVDYLENNLECNIVHTNLRLMSEDGTLLDVVRNQDSLNFRSFEDMLSDNKIYSVTAMFRNFYDFDLLPRWMLKYPFGDLPTYLWALKNGGTINLLNDITSVYRLKVGISSKLKNHSDIVENIIRDVAKDKNFYNKKKSLETYIYNVECATVALFNRERQYIKATKNTITNLFKYRGRFKIVKVYIYSLLKAIKISRL